MRSSWPSCKLLSSKPELLLMSSNMALGLSAAKQQPMLPGGHHQLPGSRAVPCRSSTTPLLQMHVLLPHLMRLQAGPGLLIAYAQSCTH